MGHFSRIIGPVAVAALVAPVTGQAADDVDALRAEIAALKADDGLNRDIGELARLLRVLSGMYDQAARAAASL